MLFFLAGGVSAGLLLTWFAKKKKIKKRTTTVIYKFNPSGFTCRACLKNLKSVCKSKESCYFLQLKNLVIVLKSAKKHIFICCALFTQSFIADVLSQISAKGVKILMIVDRALCKQGSYGSAIQKTLVENGIIVKSPELQDHIMHHKFLIIDDKILLIGSMNWTSTGFFGNYENVECTNNKESVKFFIQEFSAIWDTL